MPLTIQVPLNTMLADLDESLRGLLKRELARHGFDGVDIVFDAPAKEWSATLSTPTVNLFLYDLRESQDFRPIDWEPHRDENGLRELRPPLRVDVSYAVTAWTRAVEDEHRLLSQVLSIMYAYPELPSDVLLGTLVNGSQRFPLKTRVAQERTDGKADFWSSIGGQYKASIDYVVSVSSEPGAVLERGPEVRTQTVRLQQEGMRGTVAEWHRIGSVVRDAEGLPLEDAWVRLVETGGLAVTDADGRFRFDHLPDGTYTCAARTRDGSEGEIEFSVPGRIPDLVIGTPAKATPKSRR